MAPSRQTNGRAARGSAEAPAGASPTGTDAAPNADRGTTPGTTPAGTTPAGTTPAGTTPAGTTPAGAKPETNLFSAEFVRANFTKLTDNAIQDLTRYVSGWSIYSIHFLNAVAQLQGVGARLDNETIVSLRRGAKRATAPDLVPLLRDANGAEEMEVERIINLIREEAGQEAG